MRALAQAFEAGFARLDQRSRMLLSRLTDEQLYIRPRRTEQTLTPFSCGEYILRSAARVEQTFGGLTTRLWDDPFEWTLPEKLSTCDSIAAYLDEVARTTAHGLAFVADDAELTKNVPAPEQLISISDLLIETLAVAAHYQGRAFAIFQTLFDERLPRL